MKRILMLALLMLLPIRSDALEADQKKHFLASVLSFGAAYVVTKDIKTSVLFGLGVGLAKEIYDKDHGDGFDARDLAADAAGVALGVLWVRQF